MTIPANGMNVSADWLHHVVPCLGFRVAEPPQPGKLLTDKLAQLGLPPGPAYARLKRGEDVQGATGDVIRSVDVVSAPRPGRIVTILGDTAPCEAAVKLARQANVLVHEATFANSEIEKAHQYGHSTAADAARTAQSASAQKLILTHISARYQETDVDKLLEDAVQIFPFTRLVQDGDIVEVPLNLSARQS
jgi:ribonuclease Z